MRKVIATIDDGENLVDENGKYICATVGMDFVFGDVPVELVECGTDIDVVKLVGLGVTPDDLIKMKASGVI